MKNIYQERIESLRTVMIDNGWDAVVITAGDPHSSEYPADRWKQVKWLTGFTGEAGDVVITADQAGLWTDTRYFIQATSQLRGTGVILHKTRIPEQILIPEWISSYIDSSKEITVAIDGLCIDVATVRRIVSACSNRATIISVPDLLSILWKDRPTIPDTPVITLSENTVGEGRVSKISFLRKWMNSQGYKNILLSSLDEIAWILNIRASDIEYNPYAISYALVSNDSFKLYILKKSREKIDSDTEKSFTELEADGIEILPYNDIVSAVSSGKYSEIGMDTSTVNYNLFSLCPTVSDAESPVPLRKAIKNRTEIEGMKKAHLLDGIAMEKFLYWLESAVSSGDTVTEWDASVKLGELRSSIDGYKGDSFETISAYGQSAALPHYVTPSENAPVIKSNGLYLNDSGGQYTFGTTDITRTVPMGKCTQLEREDYTLVLMGHINLAMAVFPKGTAGCQIDALAREPLWSANRNFGHGTGHGIGFYLGVHEGPQDIRQNFNRQCLIPGMITSDEPGIYREGMHGIRHENLILCVEDQTNEFGIWLRFETLTLCHFDTTVLDTSIMTEKQIDWLNSYNKKVFTAISPYLESDECTWLQNKTKPISK